MSHLRRALAPVAALWLLCQVGTVALVPGALWMASSDTHSAECSCGHGPAATCPMHHKRSGGSTPCALQAPNTSAAAVLTALLGTAGIVAEPASSIQLVISQESSRPADMSIVGERPVPPDPPPPRL